MNKFKKNANVLFLAAVFSVVTAALLWMWIATPARGQSKSEESRPSVTSTDAALPGLRSVNQAFRVVKDSASVGEKDRRSTESSATTTEAAVRVLADAVLQDFGLEDLPKEVADEAKERLITAEIDYREGRGGAIAETSVVRLIDKLANSWNAPAYARTNQHELRRFRVNLVQLMPDLATRNSAKSLIAADMSPLEATYVTLLLIEQKTINPAYQLTPLERAKQPPPEKSNSSEPESFLQAQSERGQEMSQLMAAVEKRVESLDPASTAGIISQALDTLGVAKTKEPK